ncbi:MAG: pyridoxal phosphate-dependent aminotransferase [Tissierellales bacterium]|jgi:aspartate aminotransferase|nr:pyridoxal phosphate-dependent aminotransferase [Tissierellales bacterium]
MFVSERIKSMQESPIRKLVPLAEEAKLKGKKVYHLNIGQPDIKTPDEFFQKVKNFDEEVLSYAFSQGIPELIDSFIQYYKSYGIEFEKDDILVTNGGSEAILFSLIAVCDYGDEILIPEPFYTNYNGFSTSAGVKVVPITTKAENGFDLPSKSEIEELITGKTKAILLSNPSNPTGKVYTEEEMNLIKEVAVENDIYIIADEVYREFVYDGLEYKSFAQLPEIEDRVILTDSISKRYSACGARIGCVASKNKKVTKEVLKLCQSRLCVATIEQVGAAGLIEVSKDYMKEAFIEYDKRRNIVFDALQDMEGVICKKPKGAFYITAKLPVENAEDFVRWLLTDYDIDNETVMFAPAEGFYATEGMGRDEIRISYVLKEEDLKKAMNILKQGLIEYNK